MDSVIKYLSKKVQPLKRCMLQNPSSSFECSPSPSHHINKKNGGQRGQARSSSIKRKFRFKLNMNGKRKRCSMDSPGDDHKHNDMTTTMNNATNNNTNPTNTLYLDSSSSSSSCSSSISEQDDEQVANQSGFFDHSLVTYKTSYARESSEYRRQLFYSHSSIEQQRQQSTPVMEQLNKLSQLMPEKDETMTPSLKRSTTISLHQNMSQASENVTSSFQREGSKCRRSNTLYERQPFNKIFDYFSNSKAMKQANIRKLNNNKPSPPTVAAAPVAQATQISKPNDESVNDIDKLEAMFFNDDDDDEDDISMTLTDDEGFAESKPSDSVSDRRRVSYAAISQGQNSTEDELRMSDEELLSYLETISCVSPIGVVNTNININNSTSVALKHTKYGIDLSSKLNESNGSIERMRRSMSMPRLAGLNCTDLSIKNNLQEFEVKQETPSKGIETETSMITSLNHQASSLNMSPPVQSSTTSAQDVDEENSSGATITDETKSPQIEQGDNFVRGSDGRMSKNIKKMFHSVISHQTNALINMERFFESQAILLQRDRVTQLSLNPPSAHKKINEYFDEMARMLEERVQTNLNLVVQQGQTGDIKHQQQQHANHNLNQKLSQMILMKHIQQHSQNRESLPLGIRPQRLFHQKGLENCMLVAANRRESTISKTHTNELAACETGEYVFKRNLSLPFRKHITPCRVVNGKTIVSSVNDKAGLKPMTKSSPHLPKIVTSVAAATAHSSSKTSKFIKQTGVSPINRHTSMKVTPSSGYAKRQTQSNSSLKSNDSTSLSSCQAICRRNSSILNRPLMPLPTATFMPIKTSTRLSDCHLQIRLRMAQLKQQHQHALSEYETQV